MRLLIHISSLFCARGLLTHPVQPVSCPMYHPGSEREHRDFLEPYLRAIWSIIGVQDITLVHADQFADH